MSVLPHDNGHYEQEFKTDQVFLHLQQHETIDNKWQCQVGEPLLENDQQHFTAS